MAVLCLLLDINHLFSHGYAHAGDEPFTYSSNSGGTGLMKIPTARVIRKYSYRLGFSRIKPYKYYYGAFSPAGGLEIGGKITEMFSAGAGSDERDNDVNFKDKSLDVKYQLVAEGKLAPALALGVMDLNGTETYSSKYVVVNKQIFPFDFTIGLGNGRFGRRPFPSQGDGKVIEILENPGKWLDDSQVFWGIQFTPSDKYSLMLEYGPRDAHSGSAVSSKISFGIGYRPFRWSEISMSYQGGEVFGFNFSTVFDIGKPLLPIYNPLYRKRAAERTGLTDERILRSLYHSGFSDIGVEIKRHELYIQAQNDKYYYDTAAVKIILNSVGDIIPEHVKTVRIVLTENGVPLFEYIVPRKDLIGYHAGRLTSCELFYLSEFDSGISDTPQIEREHRTSLGYHIGPVFEAFLNGPSDFFTYRMGISAATDYALQRGGVFAAGISAYPLNNVPTVNEAVSISVRSDLPLYRTEELNLERLMYDYVKRFPENIYTKVSAGLLEVQYAGIEAEAARPVLDGRILLGLNGSAVKKRAPGVLLKLRDDAVKDVFTTAFFNSRFNFPEREFSVDIRAGRFLAGDYGARFTVTKFINGVKIRAWYTVTDTSIFADDFNRGYNDMVFGVSIPLRLFAGTDSKTTYSYSLSSLTGDPGQDIEHYNPLFDFINRDTKTYFKKDWERDL